MMQHDPEQIVDRLVRRRLLAPMEGSTTHAAQRRTPFSCGIMVHALHNMPLLAGSTKVTIRLAIPTSTGFEFFNNDDDDDGLLDGVDEDGSASGGGISQIQDDGSLCVAPTFSSLWIVSRGIPVNTVAVISVSCIERVRKECVGTVGFLVVNMFGKRGTFVSRLQYGDDPAVTMNVMKKNHRGGDREGGRNQAALSREQMSAPTIPLLGVRYTCYWGGGYPTGARSPRAMSNAAQDASPSPQAMEDEMILSDFRNFSVTHDHIPVLDLLHLTAEEQMIQQDRDQLGGLGYVADARPSAINLGDDAASAIFLRAEKDVAARQQRRGSGDEGDEGTLHDAISSFDKLGVTPFNPLRGVVIALHHIRNPEPFPTPAAARENEVTVPNAALNQHCIYKVVVEVGGLLPGVSHLDWGLSTLAEPVFDVRKSTITVKNVPVAAGSSHRNKSEGDLKGAAKVRFANDDGDADRGPQSEGPFRDFIRNKAGASIAAVYRVYALVPNYSAFNQLVSTAPSASSPLSQPAGDDQTEREARLAQSALVKLGFMLFDPGNPAHWIVVPHSWGASLIVAQGQPFTVASFRTEVPLYRGQPTDSQLMALASARGATLEPIFKAWEQSGNV